MRRLIALVILLSPLTMPAFAAAEGLGSIGGSDLQRQVELLTHELKQLRELVEQQQGKIQALESDMREGMPVTERKPLATEVVPEVSVNQQSFSGRSARTQSQTAPFIPDIGVVADFVGTHSQTLPDDEGNDRLSLRELELVFGSDIDPFARFDATLTFSDFESPDVEEAYVSYWNLPWETNGRIGRMHQRIGKASATHRDSLDTVDEPLVVQRYLGAEGLFRTGVDVSGFLPFSTDTYVPQLALGMMEGGVGEGGELFADASGRPSLYGHMSNYWDIDDRNNFELGGTYLLGSGEKDSYAGVHAFGIDATFIHHLSSRQRLKLQGELFFTYRRKRNGFDAENDPVEYATDPLGYYVLADYRLAQRWGAGFRLDAVEPIQIPAEQTRGVERALSPYITFYQSEFARWRFQYQYARLLNGEDDSRFFLQGTFAIGTHKHQIQ